MFKGLMCVHLEFKKVRRERESKKKKKKKRKKEKLYFRKYRIYKSYKMFKTSGLTVSKIKKNKYEENYTPAYHKGKEIYSLERRKIENTG